MKYYPDDELKQYGENLASALMSAHCENAMHGLGGCREFKIDNYPENMLEYILAYLNGNNDSIALIYAAMRKYEENIKA